MKRFIVMFLCTAAVALMLGLCACGSSAASSSSASESATSEAGSAASAETASSESASSESAASEPAASTASAEASASAASSAAASASEAAGFDFVDECTDEHGNITLYALTELKGWQVATLLDQQEYEWQEANSMWVRPMDGATFSAVKETGVYTIDTYNEMNEKGGAIAAIGLNVVAGYKDSQAALKGNAKCVVEDSYFDGNDGIAIFYGPSMKEYLAIISQYTESTTLFMIFSQEAVGSGMADEYLGTQVGGSFKDVWKSITGKDSYGH